MQTITPFLWLQCNIADAANYYTAIFKDAKIIEQRNIGPIQSATVELLNQRIILFNGGEVPFVQNEATSLFVSVETQEEVDYYWNALTANGGNQSQCGWLKDKYGLSWQIIPAALGRYLYDADKERAGRAMQAMLKMKKIVIADLEAAFNG